MAAPIGATPSPALGGCGVDACCPGCGRVRATPVAGTVVVKVIENEGKAAVHFWQNYESPTFRSRVLKKVDLARAGDSWKIRRENLIQVQPPLTVSA